MKKIHFFALFLLITFLGQNVLAQTEAKAPLIQIINFISHFEFDKVIPNDDIEKFINSIDKNFTITEINIEGHADAQETINIAVGRVQAVSAQFISKGFNLKDINTNYSKKDNCTDCDFYRRVDISVKGYYSNKEKT